MSKKERSEKQKLNDEKLRSRLKVVIPVVAPVYSDAEIIKIDVITMPKPPVMLGRVRSRKMFWPYDVIDIQN